MKTKYAHIQNAIYSINSNGDKDIILYDEEIEDLLNAAQKEIEHRENIGYAYNRIKHNIKEKAFHDNWLEINKPLSGINHGNGILQDLFFEGIGMSKKCIHRVSPNERMVAATVIQWLGSNLGFAFLERVLNQCGYKIIKK